MEFLTFLLDSIHEELMMLTPSSSTLSSSTGGPVGTYWKYRNVILFDFFFDFITFCFIVSLSDDSVELGWEEVTKGKARKSVNEQSRQTAIQESAASPISSLFHGIVRSELKQQGKVASVP